MQKLIDCFRDNLKRISAAGVRPTALGPVPIVQGSHVGIVVGQLHGTKSFGTKIGSFFEIRKDFQKI